MYGSPVLIGALTGRNPSDDPLLPNRPAILRRRDCDLFRCADLAAVVRFLAVDPGEDVGWSTWNDGELIDGGTEKLWKFIDTVWDGALAGVGPLAGIEHLVVEDWRLYPWEVKSMAWDPCRTARGIGALELIARKANLGLTLQPAKIKERAEAAGAREFFYTPLECNRHFNDSVRHAVYFLAVQQGARKVAESH